MQVLEDVQEELSTELSSLTVQQRDVVLQRFREALGPLVQQRALR